VSQYRGCGGSVGNVVTVGDVVAQCRGCGDSVFGISWL
jgi:hypothetical protein